MELNRKWISGEDWTERIKHLNKNDCGFEWLVVEEFLGRFVDEETK